MLILHSSEGQGLRSGCWLEDGGPGPVSKSPSITVVSGGRIEGFRGVTFMRSLIPLKRAEPFLDPPLSNTSHCGVECST